MPGGGQRAHPGLVVRRDRPAPGEIVEVDGIRATSPLRTTFDLGRRDDLLHAVVAVDALAHHRRSAPDLLLNFAVHHPRARGVTRLYEVLAHTDPERVLRDIARHTRLLDQGRRVYRYTRNEIRTEQARIVDEITRARVK